MERVKEDNTTAKTMEKVVINVLRLLRQIFRHASFRKNISFQFASIQLTVTSFKVNKYSFNDPFSGSFKF